MAIKTELSRAELEDAAAEWDLGALREARGMPQGSINTLYRLETDRGWHVLRLSEGREEPEVVFETELLSFLGHNRYPAVTLAARADGALYGKVRERFACVFRWAPGEPVSAAELTPEQALESGRVLARLHQLAEGFDGRLANRYGWPYVLGAVRQLAQENAAPDRTEDPELWAALPLLERAAEGLDELPSAPEGTIHGDWFPDNLRYAGDRVSCVLDFEMACHDPFVLDLATAVHACCYTDDYEPRNAASLVAGYQSVRRLAPDEKRAFWPWAVFSALRFTVTRIADYHRSPLEGEKLKRKDWRRFRDRLRKTMELGAKGWGGLLGL